MKLYVAFSTSDPYEPRSMDGIFTSIERAKAVLPAKYLWMKTDKCKTEDEYENIASHKVKAMDHRFGPDCFIEEVESDQYICIP